MSRPKSEQARTNAERQAAWRNRRVTESAGVTETRNANPIVVTETLGAVTETPVATPPVNPPVSTRQSLRDRLAALEAQYRAAQRAQDWPACRRANEEREPLFGELWELERELPESERWWFPARVMNDDRTFARK